jgi:hypothetical protein
MGDADAHAAGAPLVRRGNQPVVVRARRRSRTLITTDACKMCPRWEARHSAAPLMLDWFGVLPRTKRE